MSLFLIYENILNSSIPRIYLAIFFFKRSSMRIVSSASLLRSSEKHMNDFYFNLCRSVYLLFMHVFSTYSFVPLSKINSVNYIDQKHKNHFVCNIVRQRSKEGTTSRANPYLNIQGSMQIIS